MKSTGISADTCSGPSLRRSKSEPFLHSWDYSPPISSRTPLPPRRDTKDQPDSIPTAPVKAPEATTALEPTKTKKESKDVDLVEILRENRGPETQEVQYAIIDNRPRLVRASLPALLQLMVKYSIAESIAGECKSHPLTVRDFVETILLAHPFIISSELFLKKLIEL